MARGLALVSGPALFVENFVLGAALSIALHYWLSTRPRARLTRWDPGSRAVVVAVGLVFLKEAVEVFIDAGTAAVSDGVAGLLGGCAAYYIDFGGLSDAVQ
jgi:hypothetical protein